MPSAHINSVRVLTKRRAICYNVGMDELKQDAANGSADDNTSTDGASEQSADFDEISEKAVYDGFSAYGDHNGGRAAKRNKGADRLLWIVIAVMTVLCITVGVCSSLLTAHFMRTGEKPPVIKAIDVRQNTAAVVAARKSNVAEVRCGSLSASGVVMKRDGSNVIVMTNTHAVRAYVESSVNPLVRFFGEDDYYTGSVLGYNDRYDIAVISVTHDTVYTVYDLDGSEFFAPGTTFSEGDYVVSMGNAMSMGIASYNGIISRKSELLECNELFSGGKKIVPVTRTTAVINAGMSGGAVFDMNGYFVGLGTYRMSSSTGVGESEGGASTDVEDTGFFTPVSVVYPIYKQIIAQSGGGAVGVMNITAKKSSTSSVGWLGLPLGFNVEYRSGALTVVSLDSGTPAKNVAVGDVVTSIGQSAVTDDICSLVGSLLRYRYGGSGDKLRISFSRGGAPYSVVFDDYAYGI